MKLTDLVILVKRLNQDLQIQHFGLEFVTLILRY
jgi:hypothetical protein